MIRLLRVLAALVVLSGTSFAQLKVITSGGFAAALQEILPEFEKATGVSVTVGRGPSQGNGPNTIGAQLRRGVPADVVILSREGLSQLIIEERIAPKTDVDVARTPLGVAVRAGAPKPDIRTVEAFKQALLRARRINFPSSTTGIYLIETVFPRLGIAGDLTGKIKDAGVASLLSGESEIAVQPVSELLHVQGVDFVGPIPSEIQYISVFSAALVAGSKEPESARRLIAFLKSESANAAIREHGMEPAATRLSWVQEGPNPSFQFHKESDAIEIRGLRHMPNWLRSDREFEDVRLRFEYKLDQWAEAGVMLRAPRTARPQRAGVTVVLAHDYHPGQTSYATGGLLGVAPPLKVLPPSFDVWHAADIELRGPRLRVRIDGELVQDTEVPDHCLRSGYVGFPDMGYGYAVRKVEAESLGSTTRFIELWNGKALAGWDQREKGGTWRVNGDVITGANGSSILYAPPSFQNFELTAVVRSHNHVNSGIFLRGQPTGSNRGFEVQIFSSVDSIYPTGSVYDVERSRVSDDYEEKWFLMQIRVEGPRCRVWLDGELVTETNRLPEAVLGPGRIGLQIHKENSSVEFRDLRVRVLP